MIRERKTGANPTARELADAKRIAAFGVSPDAPECFVRLPGLNFKRLLEQSGISATTAIQSLKPTQPAWNRKLH